MKNKHRKYLAEKFDYT